MLCGAVFSNTLDGAHGVVVGLALGVVVVSVIRRGASSQDLG